MNPLVEQMLNTKSRNDLEREILEQTFEEDCKCQSDHTYNGDTCSGEVTAKISRNCGGHMMVCYNAEIAAEEAIVMQTHDCGYCKDRLEKCWTIRPI